MNTRRNVGLCLAGLMASCMATQTNAAITILKANGAPASAAQATKTFDPNTGGWNITLHALYAPGQWTRYDIHGNAGEVIDNLIIDVPCLEGPGGGCLPAGSPVLVNIISDAPGGLTTVHNIVQTGTAETILGDVDVREDLGSVEVEVIGILHAGRDVIGPIRSTTPDNPQRGITEVIADRHILGDITADFGRITLVVAYGAIGAPGAPVEFRAKHNIVQIAGFEATYANVNTRNSGGAGRLFAFGSPMLDGSITTEALMDHPTLPWPGRIQISEVFDGSITIGKSHTDPDHWIDLPDDGLTGPITINADNHPAGAWSAPVNVGWPYDERESNVIVLDGPGYAHTASLLGGGSIGLVPFALHESSCTPPRGATIPAPPGPPHSKPTHVRLRHYGAVALDGNASLIIRRRVLGSGAPFMMMNPSHFEVSVDPQEPYTVNVQSAAGGFDAGFEYEIEPADAIVCDVPGFPQVAWSRSYRFGIEPATPPGDCEADLNGNGMVDFNDMTILLANWGDSPSGPGDIDGDGAIGFNDFVALLATWGPC